MKPTQTQSSRIPPRLEMFKQPGDVVRVEVQLRGNRLRKAFTGLEHRDLTSLSFQHSYEVYREIMCGFCPAHIPRVSKLAHLLALGELEGWKTKAGISQFDIWKLGVSRRHVSRVRREMASLRPETYLIDWETLLPNAKVEMPPLVEVERP